MRLAPGRQVGRKTSAAPRGSRPVPRALCRARSSSDGQAEPMLWVPKTTSTHGARSTIVAAVLLRQAAADRDLHVRSPLLDRVQVPEVAVEPVVGVLAHRTGVENDDVRTVRHVSGRRARIRPARAGRIAARSRGRSSGTRRCGWRRCASWRFEDTAPSARGPGSVRDFGGAQLTDHRDANLAGVGQLILDLLRDLTGDHLGRQVVRLRAGCTMTRTSRPDCMANTFSTPFFADRRSPRYGRAA